MAVSWGGGHRQLNATTIVALLVRTDSFGDTLWTHTYQKYASQEAFIQTVTPLNGNRILVGAFSVVWVYDKYGNVDANVPWFLILDSMGNIIKDTLYDYPPYGGGGSIYKDKNGGYFHEGQIINSSFNSSEPFIYSEGSTYVAHLDTNFHIQWFTLLPYDTTTYFERFVEALFQLEDGNILAFGESLPNYISSGPAMGWAAKFDRTTGAMLWQHLYTSDATHDSYIRGVVEKPDGSLVFTGTSMNDTLPAWHTNEDVWLVGTDSNGCQVIGCSPDTPTAVTSIAVPKEELLIYPNPTNNNFIVKTTEQGSFSLYTMQGQLLQQYNITATETNLQLPPNLAPGIYIGIFTGSNGSRNIIRLVYQP